eukprot:264422-Rhodomonas_salina.1
MLSDSQRLQQQLEWGLPGGRNPCPLFFQQRGQGGCGKAGAKPRPKNPKGEVGSAVPGKKHMVHFAKGEDGTAQTAQ